MERWTSAGRPGPRDHARRGPGTPAANVLRRL